MTAEILRLLQASSCFRGEVCSSLPCACAETLARLGARAPTTKAMEVINKRLADYEELESRNDLTDLGKHAKLAIQNLKRDVEYALVSTEGGSKS